MIKQTSNDWFAVMVLDGGSDRKTKINFDAISHSKLNKFKFSQNQGNYFCREKAIDLANTDWYFHLDADDVLPLNAVEIICEKIESNPKVSYIGGSYKLFSKGHEELRPVYTDIEKLCIKPLFLPTSPIKKDLLKKFGGYYKPKYYFHSDWDFWLSVYEENVEGVHIDEVIYLRRLRQDSSTWKHLDDLPYAIEKIIERHPKYFHSFERKNKAIIEVFEKNAIHYRKLGKRVIAKHYAEKALELGHSYSTYLNDIIKEYHMPWVYYKYFRFRKFIYVIKSKFYGN